MVAGRHWFALAAGLSGVVLSSLTAAAASTSSSGGCAPAAVVSETLSAPRSQPEGRAFTARVDVVNCTDSEQSLTLEGSQTAPGSCTAPVIDPLPLRLAPHQRFTLRERVPGQSCAGTYIITWSVIRGTSTIAQRTIDVRIT